MNIRYFQKNLLKIHEDNMIKFLTDLLVSDFQNIDMYEDDKIYKKGDRVYLQEDGKHQLYQCIVPESSNVFNVEEWENILNIYPDEIMTVNNLVIKEETHIITEETVNSIVTNLEFDEGNTSFAIYCGMNRYIINHDFTVDGKTINFMNAFDIGDKVIIELRETIGKLDRLVLQSTNGNNYEICVIDNELHIVKSDTRSFKREVYIRDKSANINYKLYMIDEDLCYDVTPINVSKNEITILDENENKYILEVVNNDFLWSVAK